MRSVSLWLLASLLFLVAPAARADLPNPGPQPTRTASPTPSTTAGPSRSHASRPIVLGLIAALFLILGGAAGARDRIGKRQQP
jgi:hypothetical protein